MPSIQSVTLALALFGIAAYAAFMDPPPNTPSQEYRPEVDASKLDDQNTLGSSNYYYYYYRSYYNGGQS